MMTSLLCAALLAGQPLYGEADFGSHWVFWSDSRPEKSSVTLPHDAMLTEERNADIDGGSGTGYYPGGKYYYEKYFQAPSGWLRSHVMLHFEGIYRSSQVYLNGRVLGGVSYGYIPFDVCLDGSLKEGENHLLVIADNSAFPNSRWYSGAGIYRPVTLSVRPVEHISDIRVKTLSIRPAIISVDVEHRGPGNAIVEIYDGKRLVARACGDHTEISVSHPKLWSAESPHLYRVVVSLGEDRREVSFGIRSLSWSAEKGFQVNGKTVLLKGGCLHHDNGILGAAEYEEAALRRISLLKSFGFNAIRSSHNPASEALLTACDSLGMYVMDESWDMWFRHKNEHDYASSWREQWEKDLETLVRHDFNHPSVVMYSVGNELSEPALEGGMEMARKVIGLIHNLDNTRPVTAGINLLILYSTARKGGENSPSIMSATEGMTSQQYNELVTNLGSITGRYILSEEAIKATTPILDALDIAGYNYGTSRYTTDIERFPERVIVGSETFPQDIASSWRLVKEHPSIIGDFMWTAWDYIGETGVGAWSYETDAGGFSKPYPWLLADSGVFDITGQPGGEAFLAKAVWAQKVEAPGICVSPIEEGTLVKAPWRGTDGRPSWSWRECEGKTARVEVYSAAPEVSLYLNGVKIGRKKTEGCVAAFEVFYLPGELRAVAHFGLLKRKSSSLKSASGRLGIGIHPEKDICKAGEIVFVNIDIEGENGVRESKADDTLKINVEGGELLGFGSARPRTEEVFTSGEYTTYYGHSQAVIRAGKSGRLKLSANGKHYQETTKEIIIR